MGFMYERCSHVMVSGRRCGSPALKRGKFCAFHSRTRRQSRKLEKDSYGARFELPVLEDANSVQCALMQVIEMVVAGRMEHKTAGMVLYALQTASVNLKRPEFEPKTEEELGGLAKTLLDYLGLPYPGRDESPEAKAARKAMRAENGDTTTVEVDSGECEEAEGEEVEMLEG